MKQKFQIAFVISVIISLLGLSVYVFILKEQISISDIEKRELLTNHDLQDFSFFNNEDRDKIESILADQFYKRYQLIELKDKIQHEFSDVIYSAIDNPLLLKQVGDTQLYQIGDYPYFTAYPLLYSQEYETRIINRIQQINDLASDYQSTQFYVYKPTQLYETDLLDLSNNIESYGLEYNYLLKNNLKVPYDYLKINSLSDYLDLQYYSDHHWTHKGVLQGYKDIVQLIFNNQENILIPWGENCFNDLRFSGSFSTLSGFIEEGAPFCVYAYALPEYAITYEGKEKPYHYDTNNFYFYGGTNPMAYHYSDAYELIKEPMTLIELTTATTNQENILIIGDSYGPAVLPLLANHFNHIYFVNPIVYYQVYDKTFDYDEFIQSENIQNVLFMYVMDNYIVSDEFGERYKFFDIERSE